MSALPLHFRHQLVPLFREWLRALPAENPSRATVTFVWSSEVEATVKKKEFGVTVARPGMTAGG